MLSSQVWDGNIAHDMYVRRFHDAAPMETNSFLAAPVANTQQNMSLAFDGTQWLATWMEHDQLRCGRIDQTGAHFDGSGIVVAAGPFANASVVKPQAISLGSCFLVAWCEGSGTPVRAVHISSSGTILDPSPIVVATSGNSNVTMAVQNNTALLAWVNSANMLAARLDASGVVLSPGATIICSAGSVVSDPAAAAGNTGYLVVWCDSRGGGDIYGERVSEAGAPLSGTGGFAISQASGHQTNPSVGWNRMQYLVAWEDDRNQVGLETDLYGARVAPDGTVLDPAGLAFVLTPGYQWNPAVTGDPSSWLVAREDYSAVSGTGADVRGQRISADGRSIVESFDISATPEGDVDPVAEGFGYVAFGYERFALESPFNGATRAFVHFSGSPGTAVPGDGPTPAVGCRLACLPNPFHHHTTITYSVPRAGRVTLGIYDVQGLLVATLADADVSVGQHSVSWRGGRNDGRAVPPGLYFARLRSASGIISTKVTLTK